MEVYFFVCALAALSLLWFLARTARQMKMLHFVAAAGVTAGLAIVAIAFSIPAEYLKGGGSVVAIIAMAVIVALPFAVPQWVNHDSGAEE